MEDKAMEPTTTPDYPRGIALEQVWAAIEADRRAAAEAAKAAEERREADRKASLEDWDKRLKVSEDRLNRAMGRLGHRIGDFIEEMIEPNLTTGFKALGFTLHKISQSVEYWHNGEILTEVDAIMEDGDKVMAIEVKSKPLFEDVKYHIERMSKLRIYADSKGDKRKYMGAVAGMVFDEKVREFALKSGFYVIAPAGNTFNIVAPEGEYKPREW